MDYGLDGCAALVAGTGFGEATGTSAREEQPPMELQGRGRESRRPSPVLCPGGGFMNGTHPRGDGGSVATIPT
jgi:hypothetical protein